MANLTSSEWSVILWHQRSPLITVTLLLFLIGFLGNLAVIIVYKLRLKRSEGRFFILYLAIADLSAVTVTSLFMMIMDFTEGLFPSDHLCKALQFLNWSTAQTSVFLLFVIAVHRYLSVCKPLELRFTRLWKKVAVGLSASLSYLLGLPLLAFSGRVRLNVKYKESNVTGYICTFNPGINEHGEAIYYNILFVGNLCLLVATTGLYIPVGKIIFLRMKNRIVKTRNNSVDLPSRTVEDSQDVVSPSQSESTETCNPNFHAATLSGYSSSSPSVSNSISKTVLNNNDANWSKSGIDVTKDCNINGKELSPKRQREKKYNVRGKFTMTLMLVVLFYVISYVPFYVMVSTGINDMNVWFNLQPWKLNGYLFLFRCYIINNVVNPIVYGMFDSTFRRHFIEICKRISF